jgi:3-oxoacyl-[acyl-carrier-protein] synthase-3
VHTRILGLGTYRPTRVIPNAELAERLGVTEEWMQRRSGIRERRFSGPDESVPAMAVAACGKALAAAGMAPEDVDVVIAASSTHMIQFPSLAAEVGFALGANRPAAFDLSAACAGFCHAVAVASDLVRGDTARTVVVVGSERAYDILDPDDQSTAFLFGDGAGAVVIGPAHERGIWPVAWGSDGSRAAAIRMSGYWTTELRADPQRPWPVIQMSGWKVIRWAANELAPVARRAMEAAGIGPANLDAFIPHQANMLITNALAEQLELPASVAIARDIASSGNTSAASVPLAMDRLLDAGEARSGDLALLIGFGSGMVYAAQVVRLP